jgi:hypothetical protein
MGQHWAFRSCDVDYMKKQGDALMSLRLAHRAIWWDARKYGGGQPNVLRPFAVWYVDPDSQTLVEQFCTPIPGTDFEKDGFADDCSQLLLTHVASGYRPGRGSPAWQIARLPVCLLIGLTGAGDVLRLPRRLCIVSALRRVSYELDCFVRSTAPSGVHSTVVIVDGESLIEIDNERVRDGWRAVTAFDADSVQAQARILAYRLVGCDGGDLLDTGQRDAVRIPLADVASGAVFDVSALADGAGKWHKGVDSAVIHCVPSEPPAPVAPVAPSNLAGAWPSEDDATLRQYVAFVGINDELVAVNEYLTSGTWRDHAELMARYEFLAGQVVVGPWTAAEDTLLGAFGPDSAGAAIATGRSEKACFDRNHLRTCQAHVPA